MLNAPPPASTIYALASAPGRASVAVLRISGPACNDALASFSVVAPLPARMARLLALRDARGELLDHALALSFPAPHSFTGEDVLELHLHGSPAIIRAVMAHLGGLPAVRLAEPGEFTRRAYLNGKMDLTAAEGLADVIQAETDAQRRQAQRQMSGEHRAAFDALRTQAMKTLALLEACIDFADEDIPPTTYALVDAEIAELRARIAALLAGERQGRRIREGIQIVIAGAPNAGKSSLLNALAQRDVAIVSPIAGTTRDALEVNLVLAGQLVTLVDTAGLRTQTADAIEREGIRRAHARAAHADLLVYLHDASQPLTAEAIAAFQSLAAETMAEQTVWVWSKTDLSNPDAIAPVASSLAIHTSTRDGVEPLVSWLAESVARLGAADTPAMVTRQRHAEALQLADEALVHAAISEAPIELRCEHLRQAALSIGNITGNFVADDVLGLIFGAFCIGK